MIKTDQILQLLSISTLILSSSLTPAIAGKPLEQNNQYTRAKAVILKPNNLQAQDFNSYLNRSKVKIKQLANKSSIQTQDISALIAQNDPENSKPKPKPKPKPETPGASVLEPLNPNPDKLAIPQKPEEVTIDLNQPITLEQAVELGLRNNKDLQEAQLNLERSRKELSEARAALFPTLGVGSQFSNSNTASNGRSNESFRQRNPSATDEDLGIEEDTTAFTGDVELQYQIYTGGRRGADIRRAKKQVERNQLDVERVTEQTIFETKRDYYSLQDADSQVEIEQAAVEDANQTLKDAQLLEQAGLGTRFDVLRAEVELANAQQRLTSANATQQNARRQLVETLSLGEQVDLTTADEVAKAGVWQLSLEESIIAGYQNRAELEQFLLDREISREQRKIALADIRPQLSLSGQFDFLEISDDDIDITTGYTVGAALQWTIFDGGAAKARARQADVDVSLSDNRFANQKNQVRLEVEQAFFSLQANEDNINTAEKAVELADESLRLARLRFQAGVGTQTDVIAAQTELTTARGNYLRAIIDYNQSLSQLQRAVTNLPDPQVDNPPNRPDTPNNPPTNPNP